MSNRATLAVGMSLGVLGLGIGLLTLSGFERGAVVPPDSKAADEGPAPTTADVPPPARAASRGVRPLETAPGAADDAPPPEGPTVADVDAAYAQFEKVSVAPTGLEDDEAVDRYVAEQVRSKLMALSDFVRIVDEGLEAGTLDERTAERKLDAARRAMRLTVVDLRVPSYMETEEQAEIYADRVLRQAEKIIDPIDPDELDDPE